MSENKKFTIQGISALNASEKITVEGAILIDVREQDEYDKNHIHNAILVPLSMMIEHSMREHLLSRFDDILGVEDGVLNIANDKKKSRDIHEEEHKTRNIIFICARGRRSATAIDILSKEYFSKLNIVSSNDYQKDTPLQLYNLNGGMESWLDLNK